MKGAARAIVAAGALVLAPTAAGHVTVNPPEAAADSFARFAIRVPTERPNADTTKITVRLPEGLFFVSFQPKPGWRRTVTMETLDPPAEVFGEEIRERVATVTWEGGKIAPGEFDEFGLSAKVPDAPGETLSFAAVQTYSNGEVVRWIGPPDADEPASLVTLGPKEGADGGGTEPADTPTSSEEASAASEGDDDGSDGLAIGLGGAGLAAGLAALAVALFRRPRGD